MIARSDIGVLNRTCGAALARSHPVRHSGAARRSARGRPRLEHAPNLLLCCPAPQLSLSPGAAAGARTPPVRRGQRTRPARATLMTVLALSPCLPVYLPRRHSGGSLSYRGAALAPHGHCGTCAEVAACGWPLPRGSGGATRVPGSSSPGHGVRAWRRWWKARPAREAPPVRVVRLLLLARAAGGSLPRSRGGGAPAVTVVLLSLLTRAAA